MSLTKDLAEVVDLDNPHYRYLQFSADAKAMRFIRTHHAEIASNAEIAEKYRNDGSTHSEGCHTWGPRHYECLAEKYKQCYHDARRLAALEQAMTEHNYVPSVLKRAAEIMRERSTPEGE